jgi:hypothetical protein
MGARFAPQGCVPGLARWRDIRSIQLENMHFRAFLRPGEIKLQKAVDRIRGRTYMAVTDAALTVLTAT